MDKRRKDCGTSPVFCIARLILVSTRPAVRRLHFMTRAPGGDARAHSHFRRDRKARSYAASRMKDHCRDPGRTQDGTRPDRGARAGSRAHVTLTVSDSLLTRGFAPPRPRTGSGPEGARRRPRMPEVRIEAAAAKRFARRKPDRAPGLRGAGDLRPGTARSRSPRDEQNQTAGVHDSVKTGSKT